jgi:pimeloyl-ACP methyl ester carboxylesterase
MPTILNSGKVLSYNDYGSGAALVLLHGYLETKEVWNSFAKAFAKKYRVIVPDIPGHGQSEILAEKHSMELVADALEALLRSLHIKQATIIGHSMGGYVMLAFADKYPESIQSMVLFHSSVYADNDEKKQNRQREIEFIKQGKLDLIVNANLPKTFSNANVRVFKSSLDAMMEQAKSNPADGICALLYAMMERPDKQALIQNFNKPMLFIFGEKDNYIPVEAGKKMAALNEKIEILWLRNSGHMGFVEEEQKAQELSVKFLKTQTI